MQSLDSFCRWLEQTPASTTIQNVSWIIPSVQSVHILAIAVVIASASMVDLRLLGVVGRGYAAATYITRYLPWLWVTLIVLLLSGSILIVGEPARSLENPAFQLKMVMLLLGIIVTFALQRPVRKNTAYWETTDGRRWTGRALALVSLCLWISIIFAGRWIAYANVGND